MKIARKTIKKIVEIFSVSQKLYQNHAELGILCWYIRVYIDHWIEKEI
jgi:hypothetical protein